MSLIISVDPYIIVPPEVANELGVDLQKVYRRGKYYIDLTNTYEVCLLDLQDNPVVCLECDLYIEEGLNRIIIPMEYLEAADITISAGKRSWKVEGKTDWIKNCLLTERDPELLKYTPIIRLRKKLEELIEKTE